MSFAAEPYGVFVDGILTGLTGGVARASFVYDPEIATYALNPPGPVRPSAVRMHGLLDNAFRQFRRTVDFDVDGAGVIQFRSNAGAVAPDLGTTFYVNYDHQGPLGAAPVLSDRNPGSVTRTLAESFAREYAVLSGQLEAVYLGAYVETATGRDLDAIAALLAIVRRDPTFATGAVVFSRPTPAAGDIAIPAGTLVSTADAPAASFETVEEVRLRRGALSAEATVRAVQPGAAGIVGAGVITVINRPVLGISAVENGQPTRFASGRETDPALRERIQRALETAGRATPGALKGALTRIEGLREKDILISEDPVLRPGVVRLDVALPEMDEARRVDTILRALDLIEETRPLGIRIEPNIDAPRAGGAATAGVNPAPEDADGAPASLGAVTPDLFMAVEVTCVVTPVSLGMTGQEREDLRAAAETAIRDFIAEAGIGETLIYNRLVAALIALDGVLDVGLELHTAGEAAGTTGRRNIVPAVPSARPVAGNVTVTLGGALVTLDVTVTLVLQGAGLLGSADAARAAAAGVIEGELKAGLAGFAGAVLTREALMGLLTTNAETYRITELTYLVNYEDDGIRINQRDAELPLSGLERLWLRGVTAAGSGGAE